MQVRLSQIKNKEVNIITAEEPSSYFKKKNWKIIVIKYSSRIIQILNSLIICNKILSNNKKSKIIECSAFYPFAISIVLLNFFYKRKLDIYIYAHGDEILKMESNLIYKICCKFSANASKKIIANSSFTSEILFKYIKKKAVIINPVPSVSFIKNSIYEPRRISKIKFLMVCRLVEKKNLLTILKIFSKCYSSSKFSLTICGDGPEFNTISNFIINNRMQNVKVFKNLKDYEILKHYKNSDIFLLPTKTSHKKNYIEGFGIVLLEAILNGLICLYPLNSGSKDIVFYSRLSVGVNTNSNKSIKIGIEKLIKNVNKYKLRHEDSINAKIKIRENINYLKNILQ